VKRVQILAALAVGVGTMLAAGLAVGQAPMQAVPAGRVGGAIALLDVSYVFKNHVRFKASMAELQADVEGAETAVKKERDQLKALADRLTEHRSGSPEYKQLEEEIARLQSNMAVKVQLQKKEFLQREAKIYHTVYREIMQEVDYYAASNGIAMVMRFNGDEVDASKPEDVLRDINKPIVWYPKDRDITPYILQALNRTAANPMNQRGPQGVGPIPR